jgi:hypothetical protein
MPTTGTVSGLTFAQDVNSANAAFISSNSGASAPTTDCSSAAVKGQLWLDTSVTPNVMRQYDGASWVALGALDASNHLWSPPIGGGAASVTAASTTDLCAAPAAVQNVSGTTTITSFGSNCPVGIRKTLIFGAATPITYDATAMILPGQRSYTASNGDVADAVYLGSGHWRVVSITRIDGSSVVNPSVPLGTILYGDYATAPAKTVLGFGQALTRTSYPDYLAAVTRAQTATLTAGNTTITSVGNTAGLGAGMPLEGTGIQSGTVIASVTSSTIVMSKTATANGSQTVTTFMTGYGSGGDSTTVGVRDCRGLVMAGRVDMGGSSSGALSSTYFGGSPTVDGVIGGQQDQALVLANLPPYRPTVQSITQPVFTFQWGASNFAASGVPAINNIQASGISGGTTTTPVRTVDVAITMDAQGGTSSPLSTVQPTAIAECAVAVLP